jgi:hypothetical protein
MRGREHLREAVLFGSGRSALEMAAGVDRTSASWAGAVGGLLESLEGDVGWLLGFLVRREGAAGRDA